MEYRPPSQPIVLHVCRREMLRPLRDQVLRISGYHIDSTLNHAECLGLLRTRPYDLILIDVEGESNIHAAESLCAAVRTATQHQLVAFICNWRVATLTDCPDEILRTEFDPRAFVEGIRAVVPIT